MSTGSKKRVCIIGAGASGLPSIKTCIEQGLEPVCFERTEDIGGIWNFNERVDQRGSVMASTVINTSKEMEAFSDFPPPKEWPNFYHNTLVVAYFRLYAKQFNLLPYIRFHTEVLKVEKAPTFARTGQWIVTYRPFSERTVSNPSESDTSEKGAPTSELFDAVMVCVGHHAVPYIPTFSGVKDFEGTVLHSHSYRDRASSGKYAGKRVAVVGFGNSALDLAVELSRSASKVYLVARRPTWVFSRHGPGGYPLDASVSSRFSNFLVFFTGTEFRNRMAELFVTQRLDHHLYGLEPSCGALSSHIAVQDHLTSSLASGAIELVRSGIHQFTKKGLEMTNGEALQDLDFVFLCTGYQMEFPFLDKSILEIKDNHLPLYKLVFQPSICAQHPTLAFIGYIQPFGAIQPISEMQARWAALLFKGARKLPSEREMLHDIDEYERAHSARFYTSNRHTIEVEFVPYLDSVAQQIGCKPNMLRLLLTDPVLWREVLFGPATPYQYRLEGPNPWPKARETILTQRERIKYPMRKPALHTDTARMIETKSSSIRRIFLLALTLTLAGALYSHVKGHSLKDVLSHGLGHVESVVGKLRYKA